MANVLTPKFRVSYPSVFKAQMNKLSNKEEYSVTALFPKGTDLSVLKKAAAEACAKKWGADQTKWPKNLKLPFRDQGEKIRNAKEEGKAPPEGYEEGGVFMTLKSQEKPGLVDEKVQDIIDTSQFYAGCFARASVSAYAYDNTGNRGISFGLRNIQKVGDGEPLSGRTRAVDDFQAIEGAETTGSGIFD
jgi:hypothetical protein